MKTNVLEKESIMSLTSVYEFLNDPDILQKIANSQSTKELYFEIEERLSNELAINTYSEFEILLEEYINSGFYIGDDIDLETTVNAASFTVSSARIQRT